MTFLSLFANYALWEWRQASYISVLFCLCSDPDSQCVHLHFMEEESPVPRRYKQRVSPLTLVARFGACHGTQTKKSRLESKQSVSHFAKGKKDFHFFVLGLLADGKRIVLVNNLRRHWLPAPTHLPESSPTEKLGKQMGMHPIYLPSRMTGAIFYQVS